MQRCGLRALPAPLHWPSCAGPPPAAARRRSCLRPGAPRGASLAWRGPTAASIRRPPCARRLQIAKLRRAYQRYTKRAALAVISVRPWVQRLQQLAMPPAVDLPALAVQHVKARRGGGAAWGLCGPCTLPGCQATTLRLAGLLRVPQRAASPRLSSCPRSCPPPRAALHTVAQVAEIASRLHVACQEQYLASFAFLAEAGCIVNPAVRCIWQ